ncbi:MAG: tryptophan--tRNA ligase [Candidatus Woesearchaeota archaeon]
MERITDNFNPWEVKGDINYDKLVKEFGVEELKDLPDEFMQNVLFRRKIVFAHRSFGQIIGAVKNKKPFVMMTGLMPTGKFHIGHMLVAQQMIFYQNLGAKIYIAVADVEAYNARGLSLEDSRTAAIEQYVLNYIALGLKPENVEIYFQSRRSKHYEKANAYYSLQNVLARHVTFNEFKAVYGEVTPGKMVSALLQASDMLHVQLPEFDGAVPVVIPVGIDQDPHIRLARDLASRYKGHNFKELSSTYNLFMPGLSGGKMSSSDPNSYIALTDTPEEAVKKIKKYAFSGGKDTVEEHRKSGGNPDIDVSFLYLKYFFEPNDEKLRQIHDDYKSGKLLSGELKKLLIDKIVPFLENHQREREHARKYLERYI